MWWFRTRTTEANPQMGVLEFRNKKATRLSGLVFTMVETRGIEPLTS